MVFMWVLSAWLVWVCLRMFECYVIYVSSVLGYT